MINIETQLLAHRYLYYVLSCPVITDYEYDALERAALGSLPPESPLHKPGSDIASDYSDAVKAYARTLII